MHGDDALVDPDARSSAASAASGSGPTSASSSDTGTDHSTNPVDRTAADHTYTST